MSHHQSSVFPAIHGGLHELPPMTEADVGVTSEELDGWFDRVDQGLPGASPFVEPVSVARAAPSAEAASYAAGDVLAPEAVFSGGGETGPTMSSSARGATRHARVHSASGGASGVGLTPAPDTKPATSSTKVTKAAPSEPPGSAHHHGSAHFLPNPAANASVFLRSYFAFSGPSLFIETSHLREIVEFCSRNDPNFAFAVQQLALQFHTGLLDAGTLPTSTAARNALLAVAALPAASELRKSYNDYCDHGTAVSAPAVAAVTPRVSVSQTHFVFRVGQDGEAVDDGSAEDAYFAARVTIRNAGRSPTTVRVIQQAFGEDGELVFPGVSGADKRAANAPVDYHVSVDRDTVKKSETATLAVSVIVKADAEFGLAEFVACVAVGPPEATLKIFVTAVLVNPHGAVFGVPPPLSCASIVHSPLGSFRVPVVLATLQAVFAARQGYAGIARTHTPFADSAEDVAAVHDARTALDELGHVPFLNKIKTSELPLQLALLGPAQLLSLMVLWIAEYPAPILPPTIASSTEPMRFLAEGVATDGHGIVLAVVDVLTRIAITGDATPIALLVTVFAEALATQSTRLLLGRVGGVEQCVAAMDVVRASVNHLAVWVGQAERHFVAASAPSRDSKRDAP